jgi:ribose transport system permease protein
VAREYGIVGAFLVLFIVLSVASSTFFTKTNLLNLIDQQAAVGIIACAGTLVIIAGGFDLSTGAVYALAGVVAAKIALATGNTPLAYLGGLGVGLACGLANGLGITVMRIHSFIATLASALIIGGFAIVITSGQLITVTSGSFANLGTSDLLGVKWTTWLFVAAAMVTAVLLSQTTFGRYVRAVGGNREAARLGGVRVNNVRALTFVLSGAAAAIAGVMIASRNITGDASSGTGIELTAIAAIVLGGTSLSGGEGAIWRTIVGVLILGMINNGLVLLNINPTYDEIVEGAIILGAVALDALAHRRD